MCSRLRHSGAAAALAACLCIGCLGCERAAQADRTRLGLGNFDYVSARDFGRCGAGARVGRVGRSDGERSNKGIRYSVRTPANYDATRRHRLLMVYAPAGASAQTTEALSGLTAAATGLGFVVAYADHAPLGLVGATELASIPASIAAKWCIDARRIYLTGHSDGGTIANIVAVMAATRDGVAGVAPSAAGVVASDLEGYGCRAPIPVMVMHSKRDTLFPGFGAEVARWWARCNGCALTQTRSIAAGCIAYAGCGPGAQTRYCEGEQSHAKWPDQGELVVEFFAAQGSER